MEPLNLMVSLSHFANNKPKKQYLSDSPQHTTHRTRAARREQCRETSDSWWRTAWRGVTKLATR
jgi:hypothetical protein